MLDFREKAVSRTLNSFSAVWCSHKIVEIWRWGYILEMRHLRENLKGEKNFNTLFVFYLRSLWSIKKDNISGPPFQRVCMILIAILLILPCARTTAWFLPSLFPKDLFPYLPLLWIQSLYWIYPCSPLFLQWFSWALSYYHHTYFIENQERDFLT